MRANTINKKISVINDNLLNNSKDLYKCVCFLEFKNDTEYYYKYKVYKKDKVIKEYVYNVDNLNPEITPAQIKKDFNSINNIEVADMDYLTTDQIKYLLNDIETKYGGNK